MVKLDSYIFNAIIVSCVYTLHHWDVRYLTDNLKLNDRIKSNRAFLSGSMRGPIRYINTQAYICIYINVRITYIYI